MSAVRNKGLAQRLRMWWRDLAALFWPPVCPVCGRMLPEGVPTVCMRCRMEAPLTGFWLQVDNPLVRKCWGLVPVVQASAFLFFVRGNGYRDLIHAFKYDGRWRLAREMGLWYGSEMARGGLYADVDVVVPVPLHLLKRLRRGYNQADYIARGIGAGLGVPVDGHAVGRRRYNASQTRKSHRERWDNVRDIFEVRHPERLRGKHVLLVDDVFTTGATILSCAETILRAVPDVRISIAVLAVSPRHIELA